MDTAELASTAEKSLSVQVLEALDDLYSPQQREEWLVRYALTGCRRRKYVMRELALRAAGVQTG